MGAYEMSYNSLFNSGDKFDDKKKDNYFLNFDLILEINYNQSPIIGLSVLNDGRLVSCFSDNNIIVYNKKTFKSDIIIKENNLSVNLITNLSSNRLAISHFSIKLFKIKGNKYDVLQTLNYHENKVNKIIELKNKSLVSCSEDGRIIFYTKDNSKYKKDYIIDAPTPLFSILETKDNELSVYGNNKVFFFDMNKKNFKENIISINGCNGIFNIVKKVFLFVGGYNEIYMIDINQHKLVKTFEFPFNYRNLGLCILSDSVFVTVDNIGLFNEWKINNGNIELIQEKIDSFDKDIYKLIKFGDRKVVFPFMDGTIKICEIKINDF